MFQSTCPFSLGHHISVASSIRFILIEVIIILMSFNVKQKYIFFRVKIGLQQLVGLIPVIWRYSVPM